MITHFNSKTSVITSTFAFCRVGGGAVYNTGSHFPMALLLLYCDPGVSLLYCKLSRRGQYTISHRYYL